MSAAARFRTRGAAIALLLAAALLAGAPGALAAPGDHPAANPHTGYARIVRACPPSTPGAPRVLCAGPRRGSRGHPGREAVRGQRRGHRIGPNGGLTPAQLASAYEYDPTEGGVGQTVGIDRRLR